MRYLLFVVRRAARKGIAAAVSQARIDLSIHKSWHPVPESTDGRIFWCPEQGGVVLADIIKSHPSGRKVKIRATWRGRTREFWAGGYELRRNIPAKQQIAELMGTFR